MTRAGCHECGDQVRDGHKSPGESNKKAGGSVIRHAGLGERVRKGYNRTERRRRRRGCALPGGNSRIMGPCASDSQSGDKRPADLRPEEYVALILRASKATSLSQSLSYSR